MPRLPEIRNLHATEHAHNQIAVGFISGAARYHFFIGPKGDEILPTVWRKFPTIFKNPLTERRRDRSICLDATAKANRPFLDAILAQKSFDQLRAEARENAIAEERERRVKAAEEYGPKAIEAAGPAMLRTLDAIAGDIAKFRQRCEEAEKTDVGDVWELLSSIEGLCKLEALNARKPGAEALARARAYAGEG